MDFLKSFRMRYAFVLIALPLSFNIAASVTFDLTGQGNQGDSGIGNDLTFSNGGINVDISSYGETGSPSPTIASPFYLFEDAEIYSWGTGIGSCNQEELNSGYGCSSSEHEVDTVGRDDMIVFYFDQVVDFENITVDPYAPGANDRDIVYWIGNVASMPDFTLETFDTLNSLAGFAGTETLNSASASYAPYTHSLSGTGNVLLLSGNYNQCFNSNFSCEAYKITDIIVSSTVVPLPGAMWLFVGAISTLLTARFKRS